ncbi:unnamed protein product [Caenorhabditis auriculariae]|uniref:PHD-type domain-containing protein n=1 Tax=Caenorhabditis auriculariae TaxID=2777116 RepID=A0A8S1HN24_9PELO|nr:unnamed protein product [Caenorhabditis auriculariae]
MGQAVVEAYCKREKLSEVASELQELVDEIEVARKENKRKESAESEMTEEEEEATEEYTEKICGECEDPLDQTRVIFNEVVVGACCGTAYYHYDCILKRATRQGLNFRCPICGSDEEDTFLRLMALQGIHPPNHSAPGSREEKPRCYFARTMRNDGRGCLCPLGATHFSGIPGEDPNFDGKWRSMPRCDICGVFAHLGCAGLPFSRSPFTCDDFDMKNLKRSPWYCDDCCHTYQVVSQKPTRKQIYDLEMGRRTGSLAKKALKGPKIVHEAIGDGERIVGSNVSTIPSQDSGVFGREDEASERVVSSDSAVPEVQAATEPPSSENQFEVNMAIDDVKTFPMLFSLDEDQLLEETPARDPLEGLEEEIDDFDSIAPENDLTTSIDEETEGTERRPEDFHDLAAALKHLETRRDPEIVWSEAPPQVQPAFIANEIEKAPNTDQQQEQLNTVKTENLDDMPLEILEPVRRRTCDIDIIQLDDSDEDDAPVEVTWKLATPQTIRMQEPQTPTTNFRASAEPNSVDSGKGRRTTPKGSKTLIEKDEKPDVPLNTVLDKWLSRARTPGKSSTPQTPSNGNEKAPDVTTVLSSKRMNNQEGSTPKRMKQELPVGTVAKSEERQPSVVQLENDCYISYSSDDDEIVVLSTFNTQKNVWQRGN